MQALSETHSMPKIWHSVLAAGAATTILGILVLIWPSATLVVAAAFFGAYLLVSGIAQVVGAFSFPVASASGRVLMFISGAASLILAVLCFRSLPDSIWLLAIWIGIGFVFRGVAEVVSSVSDSVLPSRGWLAFAGALSVLAGFVLLGYPFSSLGALVLVAGVWLVVLGVSEVIAALRIRSAVKASGWSNGL